MIGVTSNLKIETWYKSITPPYAIGSGYPVFVSWLCDEPVFDIGIAPLVDNEFNRCKSEIKFLDYSVLGLVTVASDISGYAVIKNGENGFRVKNVESEWYNVLKNLITDADLRNRIQLAAQNDVFEKYGYKRVDELRVRLLASLMSRVEKKINNIRARIDEELI